MWFGENSLDFDSGTNWNSKNGGPEYKYGSKFSNRNGNKDWWLEKTKKLKDIDCQTSECIIGLKND